MLQEGAGSRGLRKAHELKVRSVNYFQEYFSGEMIMVEVRLLGMVESFHY